MKRDLIQQHGFFSLSVCLMLMLLLLLLLLLQANNGIKIFRYGQKRYSAHSLHSLSLSLWILVLFCIRALVLWRNVVFNIFFSGCRYLPSMGEREWLKLGETNIISLFTGSAISGHFNNCMTKKILVEFLSSFQFALWSYCRNSIQCAHTHSHTQYMRTVYHMALNELTHFSNSFRRR